MNFTELSRAQLEKLQAELTAQYEALSSQTLNLDLTRGKPNTAQVDLASSMDGIIDGFFLLQDGTDVRNYGGLSGIPEARQLGADLLGLDANQILVGGNSSLTLMYQFVAHMMREQWSAERPVRFICPVPGYDRHFTICEHFDIEMITVPMTDGGPDMDQIESLVASDPQIKGIWCVPKYSNPTGHTYSDGTVKRFASLATKAGPGFRIMWDNAYAVHHLTDQPDKLLDLMPLAEAQGCADSVAMFGSTSKITFAGAGVAFIGLTVNSLAGFEKFLSVQTIGSDKVNQLRHVRFLKDGNGIAAHMEKHRELLAPRFAEVQKVLHEQLGGKGIAEWAKPRGGYFVSLDTLPGLASKVVSLANDVGVKLTPAGATFPYGRDPIDQNIRIAPTFPSQEALSQALNVLAICVQLASINKLLSSTV